MKTAERIRVVSETAEKIKNHEGHSAVTTDHLTVAALLMVAEAIDNLALTMSDR